MIALPEYPIEGTGSFCLIDRKVIESIRSFGERNRVIFGLISWAGFKRANVYYDRKGRQRGESKWNYRKMLKTGFDVLTSFSYIPLRLSMVVGIIFLVVSVSMSLYVFIDWFIRRNVEPGWPSLMISIYLIAGIQMLFLGVIGEYIWRISEDVKKRPIFIVRDRIGFSKAPHQKDDEMVSGEYPVEGFESRR